MARLVICDDEARITEILARYFTGKGHEVHGVTRAEEALALLAAHAQAAWSSPIDLVITDIAMQGLTGLDLLRRVRSEYPDLPVIVTTGNPSHDSALNALREGAFDYLVKPFHLEEMAERVLRALAVKRLRDDGAQAGASSALLALAESFAKSPAPDDPAAQALALGRKLTRSDAGWLWTAPAPVVGKGAKRDSGGTLVPAPQAKTLRAFLLGLAKASVAHGSVEVDETSGAETAGDETSGAEAARGETPQDDAGPAPHARGDAWFLSAPIETQGRPGALILRRAKSQGRWSAGEMELAGRLAAVLTLALRNGLQPRGPRAPR